MLHGYFVPCSGMDDLVVGTAVAVLSLTLGVQLNMRLSQVVFKITPMLALMYLQLHVC